MSEKMKVKISTSSVYTDLGYENYEEMETKANLAILIGKTVKKKRLSQTNAAKVLGIRPPKLSTLLRGHFRRYSVERLMKFLNALGEDVFIIVSPKPKTRKARLRVHH